MRSSVLVGVVSSFLFFINNSNGQLLKAKSDKILSYSKPVNTVHKTGDIKNDPSLSWRLPQNILPSRYELSIIPILDEGVDGLGIPWTVPGNVKIHLSAQNEPTNKIVLHVKDIQIISGETQLNKLEDNSIIQILSTDYNETTMHLTLNLNQELEINTIYVLRFIFVSKIQEEFHGMYRSSYVDPDTNEIKWTAITQMEALHARELFPCFDEPSFKSVFSTRIGRKTGHVALTNGHSIGTEPIPNFDGLIWETFNDTVPMSTYLFAIVISEYGYSEAPGIILPDTVVRTYAPKHLIERGGGVYSSEIGELLLKDYEIRFGQTYPLGKMDMVSVLDFTFGAMENFGLNIYREPLLLYYADESTETERATITQVMAHELAHQYFGNLVSPAWWTHIWLNEGMASYVQYVGMHSVTPEFNVWEMFLSQQLQRALAYDSVPDVTHSLKIEEEKWIEQDAMSWFSTIAYQKGGSIARMMEGFLTPQVFQDGLKTYQERKKFESAVEDDLFEALGENAEDKLPFKMNLSRVMKGWTEQSGYPLLMVSSGEGNKFTVTQLEYKKGPPARTDKWVIPISVASKDNPNFEAEPEYWLEDTITSVLTLNETLDKWIVLNAGSTGFYRCFYAAGDKLILDQLQENHSVIHPHSRSQLIDDYFSFAWDEYLSWESSLDIASALEFTKYMSAHPETEIVVWNALFKHLEHYLNTFGSAGMIEDMKRYLLPRIKSAIIALGGFDKIKLDSKGIEVINHAQLLDWACALEDDDCIDYAAISVDSWKTNITDNSIPHDLRPVLYCAAAGKDKSYSDFFITEYSNMTNGLRDKQRQLLLNSFQCINDGPTIDSLIGATLNEDLFHNKVDSATFLQSLASNYKMRDRLVSFVRDNTSEIITWFDNGEAVVNSIVSSLSNFLSTSHDLNQIGWFISDNREIFNGTLDIYFDKIANNIRLIQKFGKPMQQYFKDNSDPIEIVSSTTPVGSSSSPTTTDNWSSTTENSSSTYNVSFLSFALIFVLRVISV